MQGEGILQSLTHILFSLILFARSFFQAVGIMPAPCDEPLKYTLGNIDARFEISQTEVLEALQEAENVWEQSSGKNLFEYDKTEGLPVQFIYDERQQKTQAGQDLQERLKGLQVEESEEAVKSKLAQYEQVKKEYESAKASYEQAAKNYNEKVDRINERGGATSEERKELEKDYKDLQSQFQNLEKLRKQVNSLVAATNQEITENHTLVDKYNQEITTFQERYGGEGEVFDQGVYTGRDISIYQYDDHARLVLVLAHEMGHALGIEHVAESDALMYYLMRDQDITKLRLAKADQEALAAVCKRPTFSWQ